MLDSSMDSDGRRANALVAIAVLALACVSACGSQPAPGPSDDPAARRAKLLDPATCQECHQQHYQEWSASMHAYASKDPVFLAMNRRGQEETGGKLGSFCVNCHAPMAVREGKTVDGLNLAEIPDALQGVTCYFCHNAAEVEGTHNNPIRLANDDTMRGSFKDPDAVTSPAHNSKYSNLMSGSAKESATFCGACHDIVLDSPAAPPPLAGTPVKLERTFSEWEDSVFSFKTGGAALPCATHHMPPPPAPFKSFGPAAEKAGLTVPARDLHEHLFPGVDVALTRFPDTGNDERDAQLDAHNRERIQYLLNTTVQVNELCVYSKDPDHIQVFVRLENVTAGHMWPSGASHDRRAWVEVKVYVDGSATPVYQSGVVAAGEDVTQLPDPDLWLLRDKLTGTGGKEPHMFWDITDSQPGTLPSRTTSDPSNPNAYTNHRAQQFPRANSQSIAAPADLTRTRVTVRVRLQPMGFDVLDDLVASGHLERPIRERMPVFDVLPNINYAAKLPQLAEVSFEWSDEVRRSGIFTFASTPDGAIRKDCLGQISRNSR